MDSSNAQDGELVLRVGRRDREAFEVLYERHIRVTYALALRILRNQHEAEEIIQEVFTTLWRRADAYDPGRGPFVTWLLSITHHRAIDRVRSRRQPTVSLEQEWYEGEGVAFSDDPLDAAALQEQRSTVRTALQALPPEQRRAIELAYYHGMTQAEIASYLSEPLGTVKTRMRLGLRKLRDALQTMGIER